VQLRLWGLQLDSAPAHAAWFVLDDAATSFRLRLQQYHRQCAVFGALPPARTLSVDHGRKRYLLYRYDPAQARAGCAAPALAWLDTPTAGQRLPAKFHLSGWAFKDATGLDRVQVLLDGKAVADAHYGLPMPGVADYWRISTDPQHPRVGFEADVDATGQAPGKHWLGLRLYGRDGSIQDWREQQVRLSPH
jgi:hypothetical protein